MGGSSPVHGLQSIELSAHTAAVLYCTASHCPAHYARSTDTDTHTSCECAPVLEYCSDPPVHGFVQIVGPVSGKEHNAFVPLDLCEETERREEEWSVNGERGGGGWRGEKGRTGEGGERGGKEGV